MFAEQREIICQPIAIGYDMIRRDAEIRDSREQSLHVEEILVGWRIQGWVVSWEIFREQVSISTQNGGQQQADDGRYCHQARGLGQNLLWELAIHDLWPSQRNHLDKNPTLMGQDYHLLLHLLHLSCRVLARVHEHIFHDPARGQTKVGAGGLHHW